MPYHEQEFWDSDVMRDVPPCRAPFISPVSCLQELDPGNFSTSDYISLDYQYGRLSPPFDDSWQHKPLKTWEGKDIMNWLLSESKELRLCVEDLPGEQLGRMDGYRLSEMSLEEFRNLDPKHGSMLYDSLQRIRANDTSYPNPQNNYLPELNHANESPYILHELTLSKAASATGSSCYTANLPIDCEDEVNSSTIPVPHHQSIGKNQFTGPKRKRCLRKPDNEYSEKKPGPGRPRGPKKNKKEEKKLGRLWEFIRDLLKNREHCPKNICWENHDEGTFRFVHSDQVAKLWGTKKGNPVMNYEKLSRAMRYYYKSQVLLPVIGRRLVYKFGPKAEGWKVDNPNFQK